MNNLPGSLLRVGVFDVDLDHLLLRYLLKDFLKSSERALVFAFTSVEAVILMVASEVEGHFIFELWFIFQFLPL